ncbi:MAG: hypothetical protein PHV79_02455 [Clostridia bacterium]|nr:hypothetical protein [Clostridia bacterium]
MVAVATVTLIVQDDLTTAFLGGITTLLLTQALELTIQILNDKHSSTTTVIGAVRT